MVLNSMIVNIVRKDLGNEMVVLKNTSGLMENRHEVTGGDHRVGLTS
jgi:hypothetical protein